MNTWSFQHVFTEGKPSIILDLPHDDDDTDARPRRGGEGGKKEQLYLSLVPFSFPSLSILDSRSPLPFPPHAAFPQLLGSV